MKIKLFVAREIQHFELGIFSFNSYVYYLTRGFIASTRAFNPLTRAFDLPTRAFRLPTRAFSVLTREFELVTPRFELVTLEFELVTRGFVLVTRGFELVTRGFELVTRGFELVTRVLLFHRTIEDTMAYVQVHGFCTASEKGYEYCVYLRFLLKSNFVKVVLVSAKSRVEPVRKITMPRLELLGNLLLSRLISSVINNLAPAYSINKIFTWTGSSVAYAWIQNINKVYKSFI